MVQELEFFPHQPYKRASATLCSAGDASKNYISEAAHSLLLVK